MRGNPFARVPALAGAYKPCVAFHVCGRSEGTNLAAASNVAELNIVVQDIQPEFCLGAMASRQVAPGSKLSECAWDACQHVAEQYSRAIERFVFSGGSAEDLRGSGQLGTASAVFVYARSLSCTV